MFGMKIKHKNINVFRQCLDCGYEQFEIEEVKTYENNRRTSSGFIVCPKCNGCHFALVGYRDWRKAHKRHEFTHCIWKGFKWRRSYP